YVVACWLRTLCAVISREKRRKRHVVTPSVYVYAFFVLECMENAKWPSLSTRTDTFLVHLHNTAVPWLSPVRILGGLQLSLGAVVGEQQCCTASFTGKPLPRAPHPDFRRKGARAFDNGNGVSAEDIEEESDLIRRLHFSNVTTKETHKALADIGKKLGPAGKQKVRSMRHTFDAGLSAKPPRRSTRGAAAGHPGQVPPVDDPNPIALPHAGPTSVSAYEYAHDGGVALGEELGAMLAELTSMAAVQRVIENTENFAEHLHEAEKRSLTTRVNDEPSTHPGRKEELSLPPAYRKGTPGVRGRCG
ncbi:unnamed protein product, partial [Ectocarpus sp. 6 AP-2014]